MQALIHIGLPKTGTTSVQAFLQANRAPLLKRGILYRRMRQRSFSQLDLAIPALAACDAPMSDGVYRAQLRLTDSTRLRAYADRVSRWLDRTLASTDVPRAVFSSEHLSIWLDTEARIAALDGWLARRFESRTYLVYLRPQEEWMASAYSQSLRNGATRPLKAFLKHQPLLDYDAVLARWAAVVGPEALAVRTLGPVPLLDEVAGMMGTGLDGLRRPARRNEALPEAALPEAHRINAWLNRRIPSPLLRKLLRDAALARAARSHPGPPLRLGPKRIAHIRDRFEAGNEAVRARWFPERTVLFPPR